MTDSFYSIQDNDIIFPQPVKMRYTSKEFMCRINTFPDQKNRTILWHLGQNSYYLKFAGGSGVIIDPYLTDYCASGFTGTRTPRSRILPVMIEPEDINVETIFLTHSHCDHTDPFTISRLENKVSIRFFAPWKATEVLRQNGIPEKNIHTVYPGEEITLNGYTVHVTFALATDATDLTHAGYFFMPRSGGSFYNTGDTAACMLLGQDLQYLKKNKNITVDVMAVCINGGYNNLSHWQAAELAARIKPKFAIPAHYDVMPHNVQHPHMFKKSLSVLCSDVMYKKPEYYEEFIF